MTILPKDYFHMGDTMHTALRKSLMASRIGIHEVETLALDAVSKVFGVPIPDIMGRSRVRRVVEARHAYMSIMRNSTRMSLADIGSIMDRDHSTVIHSCRTAKNLIETDWIFKETYRFALDEMREQISNEELTHE